MNVLMMDLAEKNGANLFFNEKCIDVNFKTSSTAFENTKSKKRQIINSDFTIGADGTFQLSKK